MSGNFWDPWPLPLVCGRSKRYFFLLTTHTMRRLNLISQMVWMHSIHDQGAGIRSFMPTVTCYHGIRGDTKHEGYITCLGPQTPGLTADLLSTEPLS